MVDPHRADRWIEVRARLAEIRSEGAIAHADKLAQGYLGKPHFYGDVYKPQWQHYERRVIVRLAPLKVTLDAIFK